VRKLTEMSFEVGRTLERYRRCRNGAASSVRPAKHCVNHAKRYLVFSERLIEVPDGRLSFDMNQRRQDRLFKTAKHSSSLPNTPISGT
jgi:hypothetical protein